MLHLLIFHPASITAWKAQGFSSNFQMAFPPLNPLEAAPSFLLFTFSHLFVNNPFSFSQAHRNKHWAKAYLPWVRQTGSVWPPLAWGRMKGHPGPLTVWWHPSQPSLPLGAITEGDPEVATNKPVSMSWERLLSHCQHAGPVLCCHLPGGSPGCCHGGKSPRAFSGCKTWLPGS